MGGLPILPCVIIGSDRLYSKRSWIPLRRAPIWLAFGDPISHFSGLPKSDARECIERDLTTAFKNLYSELQQTFRLTSDDLLQAPRERMASHALSSPRPRGHLLRRVSATSSYLLM